MGQAVTAGAVCQCNFGMAPTTLGVLPDKMVLGENKPMANIMDNKLTVNIVPFGMCRSMSNPAVAAATASAGGVLTPAPCTPVTPSPWAPGSATVLVKNFPALNNSSKLVCSLGGIIQINNAGTTTVQVP